LLSPDIVTDAPQGVARKIKRTKPYITSPALANSSTERPGANIKLAIMME
jgi:hypothetical protein